MIAAPAGSRRTDFGPVLLTGKFHAMQAHSRGFTLIELMIVIAIIGILAAVAIPAYGDYVKLSGMAKVNSHYEEALRAVENGYARAQSRAALGLEGAGLDAAVNEFHVGLIQHLNPDIKRSPGGDPGYAALPDDRSGVIGVVTSGSDISDFAVVITRPAYADLTSTSTVITFVDL